MTATSHWRTVWAGLLLALGVLPLWPQAQAPKPTPAARSKRTHNAAQPKSAAKPAPLPQALRVGNTEMPLTEVVPSTEAALGRLQEILAKARDPALPNLQQSLALLSSEIAKSKDETLYLIRGARSSEQLMETRALWRRDWQKLENLNAAVRMRVQALTEQQRQAHEIQQTWSAAARSAEELGVPGDLLQRIQQTQQTASSAEWAAQSTLESLVRLQVAISDNRKSVDDVLQEIESAQRRVQASIFALDSPPLWSALRQGSYASLREQARITVTAVRSRSRVFYSSHRNVLLAYLVLLLVLTVIFFRLQGSQEEPAPGAAARVLRRPFSLAAFILLYFFALFFPGAPPEVIRFSQFLMVFPLLRIALAIFDDALHYPIIVLSLFYALDGMTGHLTAGTLLRRLLVLFLTAASMAGLVWLLRPRGPLPALLARERWTVAGLLVRIAWVYLAVSAVANVVGCVALADLLLHGTLRAVYSAMAVYVTYLVVLSLASVVTLTRFGQMSRMVKLHRELVLARTGTLMKLMSWIVWVVAVLFSYQVAHAVFAGFRSILSHRWTIGAISISLGDIALFFLVFIAATLLAKAIRFFLEEELLPRTRLGSGVAQASSRLAHYALVLVGFFLAMAAAGLDLGRVTLLTGAFGVGLGFGLQGLVNNFVSGIIISLERPMQVGDVIEVGNLLGEVKLIGFRSSTVRTFDGAAVVVPNSELITKSFVNWSLTDQHRRGEVRVRVVYGTEPSRVLEILATVAGSHASVFKKPAPTITFDGFGEHALEFSLRFWTTIDSLDSVRSDLNVLVAAELKKNGILLALAPPDAETRAAKAAAQGT